MLLEEGQPKTHNIPLCSSAQVAATPMVGSGLCPSLKDHDQHDPDSQKKGRQALALANLSFYFPNTNDQGYCGRITFLSLVLQFFNLARVGECKRQGSCHKEATR